MPYAFTLTATIPASAREIYEAWLDSIAHSEMTGGEAMMSDEVGAEFSAWDGYITGRNLELVAGERIVQSWRTSEFGDELEDSIITVTLDEVGGGTLLTIEHSNVPDEHKSYEEGGWQSNYFEPMVEYFVQRQQAASTPPKSASKRATKKAAKPAPEPAAKPVVQPAAKSARTAKNRAAKKAPAKKAPQKKLAAKKIAAKKKTAKKAPAKKAAVKKKKTARTVSKSRRPRPKPSKKKSGRAKRR
jgi:uncharacterized protein YndB with AHSA1/START domain